MNTVNAIGLGAYCQRKFNMPETYNIRFVAQSTHKMVIIPKLRDVSFVTNDDSYMPLETEKVILDQVAVRQGDGEILRSWVGYSPYANTLFIEADE